MIDLSKETLERVREAAALNRKAGGWVAPNPLAPVRDKLASLPEPLNAKRTLRSSIAVPLPRWGRSA